VYTRQGICRWVSKIAFVIFSGLSVTKREYGTWHACEPAWQRRYSLPATTHPFTTLSRFQLTYTMTDDDERELENELARLQQEHRDLDAAIDALHQSPAPDLLRLQRLKKRKLQLRDRIAFIEDQITPDIIA
jgi:hypothetical protein